MNVFEIVNALRSTTSTNEKLEILKSNKDDDFFRDICKFTYDKVTYTYGVTSGNFLKYETDERNLSCTLCEILNALNDRKYTGHNALKFCKEYYNGLSDTFKPIFCQIIDRDLKIGVSTKTLNKVWKNLIPKPNYCRCDVFSSKTASKIRYPAFIQLKCDGTYREAYVNNGVVSFKTRAGEPDVNPIMAEVMKGLPNGYYMGEFTIGRADDPDANRSEGNGLINSDNPPYEKIHFTVWDYLTEDEYALKECKNYDVRFADLSFYLEKVDSKLLHVVPSYRVYNSEDALRIVSEFMNKGLEGGVLKSYCMKFKNGTSKEQLKIKLKVDADLRVVGFLKGNKGTKYENMNKVIVYKTDDGKIKGQCSGMTDKMVEEVTRNPEKYIGSIVSVQFNDITKSENNYHYALSHPHFQEFRLNEKSESDTFERIVELRNMARDL